MCRKVVEEINEHSLAATFYKRFRWRCQLLNFLDQSTSQKRPNASSRTNEHARGGDRIPHGPCGMGLRMDQRMMIVKKFSGKMNNSWWLTIFLACPKSKVIWMSPQCPFGQILQNGPKVHENKHQLMD